MATWAEQYREEGRQETRQEIYQEMVEKILNKVCTIADIAQITGLSSQTILNSHTKGGNHGDMGGAV